MIRFKNRPLIRDLGFAPPVEAAFQESYYERVRGSLGFSICLLAGVGILSAMMPLTKQVNGLNLAVFVGVIIANLLLLVWSRRPDFAQIWQPIMVATTLVSVSSSLLQSSNDTIPFVFLYLILIAGRVQRLQLRWMTLQFLSFLLVGSLSILIHEPNPWPIVLGTLVFASLFMALPLLLTLRNERFERSEFWTKHELAQERNDERHKREQSEKMLHVLSQAIGGIVHDLGNPLTAVQSGAETLLLFVREGETDNAVVEEFAEIISDGARMLNYLRLSLMEQTRVLEGKPVPIELKTASIRELVKSGAHYQKPKFAGGRRVSLQGDDLQVEVDEMRFITIFMNLIGNALKYSDGEILITWRTHENQVLIAVLDQGQQSQGISYEQAQKLFVAFGRLENHAQIEGTGLGLLSVRCIAEAHQGEVYIEGTTQKLDNTEPSPELFSTAQGNYPSLLEAGFRTAFVTACPLKIVTSPQEERSSFSEVVGASGR